MSSRASRYPSIWLGIRLPISRADVLNTVLERAFAVLGPEQGAIFLKGADGKLFRAAERQSSVSAGPLLVEPAGRGGDSQGSRGA